MILPNLSGIESAFGEDLSQIEPANREDESGEDESRIESSSGVDFAVTKKRKKPSNDQIAKNKSAQEPITRSVQLPYFRATAFSQVELF